jgi:hypothetical protein
MLAFVELGESLVYNNRPTFVEFKRPRQYLHLTDEEYKKYNLDDLAPEKKKEFIKRLQLIDVKRQHHARKNILPAIHHNLHEYLTAAKPTTSLGRLSSKISSLPSVLALSWKLMRSS